MIHRPTGRRRARPMVLALALAWPGLGAGCSSQASVPEGGSPVVAPGSPEAVKAIAERDRMIREREAQEAKARRKSPITAEAN